MTSLVERLLSLFVHQKRKPRIYIDASRFDPYQARNCREAVILVTCNEAETIFERVTQMLRTSASVVVVDQGSSDGTPYLAAEAGAVVLIQDPGMSPSEAMQEANRIARQFSQSVVVKD